MDDTYEDNFDKDFLLQTVLKLDWAVLVQAAKQFSFQLPLEWNASLESNDALLHTLHTLLFDIHILQGSLVCPSCLRSFPIHDGIPNMLLDESEIES